MQLCTQGGSRNLQLVINFFLLTSSLLLIGTGASLMGFYRIHLLDVITLEFIIVPLIMLIGGIFILFVSVFGFYVAFREDSCLLVAFSVLLSFEFVAMIIGIIASVRLMFDIQTGLLDSDVIQELSMYETDSRVRYKWDTLQRK